MDAYTTEPLTCKGCGKKLEVHVRSFGDGACVAGRSTGNCPACGMELVDMTPGVIEIVVAE